MWGFIRPGLYPRERRLAIPFVLATTGCFLAGAAFAYLNAFKFLGDILFQEALNAGLRTNLHLEDYLDLFIYTVLGTGIMFELPVLVYFLARFRLVTARWMLKYWRHATIVILFVGAFLTPGDVMVTTIFFSVVLLGLYFISILVAWVAAPRSRGRKEVLPRGVDHRRVNTLDVPWAAPPAGDPRVHAGPSRALILDPPLSLEHR